MLLTILGAGRLGIGIFAFRAANALERPNYQVLRRLPGGVELRRYEPYVIAETTVEAPTMREAGASLSAHGITASTLVLTRIGRVNPVMTGGKGFRTVAACRPQASQNCP